MIPVQPHIAHMAAYAVGHTDGAPPRHALAQNESLRPPSPLAIGAMERAAQTAALYPDPDCAALREALGDLHDLDPATLLCGAGSLDLIGALTRCYAGPDAAVLAPVHAYPFFRTAAEIVGARFDTAPESSFTVSIDALLSAVQPDTRIVFVANPANPTGTRISTAELRRLRRGLPANILLIIDEAYGEFADHLSDPCWDLVDQGNCVVLRTFSKAYGLAGLRIGWGAVPAEVSEQIRKVLNPNAVSSAAQAAACAAVDDQTYMRETCDITTSLRTETRTVLQNMGFSIPETYTNFLLIPFPDTSKAQSANRALRQAGIVLRAQSAAGLPHALRLTIGPQDAMQAVLSCLSKWRKDTS